VSIQRTRFQTWSPLRARQSPQGGKNVFFGSFFVEERNNFDFLETSHLRLPQTYLCGKAFGIGHGIFQVVLRVCVFIDAHRNEPRRTRALQTVGAGQHKVRVFALYVVFVEGVRGQTVRSRNHGDFFFQGGGRLSFQGIAVPDLHERAVAEQTHIMRAAALRMFFVGDGISYFDLYFDVTRGDARRGSRFTCER